MRHAHPGGFVVLGGHDCRAAFPGFSWSHLWSHSCRFGGVRGGLRRLGSGVAGPNRTSLIHRPQNSPACSSSWASAPTSRAGVSATGSSRSAPRCSSSPSCSSPSCLDRPPDTGIHPNVGGSCYYLMEVWFGIIDAHERHASMALPPRTVIREPHPRSEEPIRVSGPLIRLVQLCVRPPF